MKRYYITTACVCLAALLAFSLAFNIWTASVEKKEVSVGFLYENDLSTPSTYNFALAEKALREEYGDLVTIHTLSNVLASEAEEPLRDLVRKGCDIIFTNSHSEKIAEVASDYPGTEFCQVSFQRPESSVPGNYHTMNGEIAQGRYICGVAAGMKLREMIDGGSLTPESALIGYVCDYLSADSLSGAAAFLMGARSEAPEARMILRQTGSWGNFTDERRETEKLIQEDGCVIIAEHTGTVGPALACEEAWKAGTVYLCALDRHKEDLAPAASLTGTRVNYVPYVTGAVQAITTSREIEAEIRGNRHGAQDLSAGFDQGWVAMLNTNEYTAAAGTAEKISALIRGFQNGSVQIYQGDYTAVSPENPEDKLNLNAGYTEYADASYPAFRYIIEEYMEIR